MDAEHWRRVKAIVGSVMARPAAERAGAVAEACGDDDNLRAEVLRLLGAADDAGSFLLWHGQRPDRPELDAGSEETASVGAADALPGLRIGPYRILEQIGEGGFGEVYLAEQTEPLRRRVAVKIVKLGMDTRQVVARFEAERQALAMMEHPNVARVFDAGATDTGRPYFVMEHVPGIPITEHCDRQRLTIEDRLRLFMLVCDAVQHAHQKGVIHRDLKPSNILVSAKDGAGVPKVIDFGVAKALHQPLTERTVFTEQGQLIGTPEYMSPEQAAMTAQDIDTRSDIYSLGVLLYELLSAALPFDPHSLREGGVGEIHRIIRDVDPPRPSTRFSKLGDRVIANAARDRRADRKSLLRDLKGPLDWIVMKAMEKSRSRRYESVSELARDVRRYLTGDPVDAAPHSTGYRVRCFVQKHARLLNRVNCAILSFVLVPTCLSGRFPGVANIVQIVVLAAVAVGVLTSALLLWRVDRSSLAHSNGIGAMLVVGLIGILVWQGGSFLDVFPDASALPPEDRSAELNVRARELLTAEPEDSRSPELALQLALEANERTDHSRPAYLATLALAYHDTGDLAKAVAVQRIALSLLPQDAADRPEYEASLARFEAALQKRPQ